MVSDTIGDFLTRIKNSSERRKTVISLPSSRMLVGIAEVLKEEGFIENFKESEVAGRVQKVLEVRLRYIEGKSAIRGFQRVSKPGARIYIRHRNIAEILGGQGIGILTTPRGLMTGAKAKMEKIGGEFLCKVW